MLVLAALLQTLPDHLPPHRQPRLEGGHPRDARDHCGSSLHTHPLPLLIHRTCDCSRVQSSRGKRAGTSLCLYTQMAGRFSVARLKMDLPFHNRLAYNRVHRSSIGPLTSPLLARTPVSRTVVSSSQPALVSGCAEICSGRADKVDAGAAASR